MLKFSENDWVLDRNVDIGELPRIARVVETHPDLSACVDPACCTPMPMYTLQYLAGDRDRVAEQWLEAAPWAR